MGIGGKCGVKMNLTLCGNIYLYLARNPVKPFCLPLNNIPREEEHKLKSSTSVKHLEGGRQFVSSKMTTAMTVTPLTAKPPAVMLRLRESTRHRQTCSVSHGGLEKC